MKGSRNLKITFDIMQLYYTIINQEDQPQNDPMYSLGGYCSSSQVPSNRVDAFYSTLSEYTLQQNKAQYICLCLRNVFDAPVENVLFYLDFDPSMDYLCKYKVAFAAPVNRQFEHIPDIFSKPVYAEFDTCNGASEAIKLCDVMQPDDMLGIWIERTINKESNAVKNRNDCQYLFDNMDKEVEKEEMFDIKIVWD